MAQRQGSTNNTNYGMAPRSRLRMNMLPLLQLAVWRIFSSWP